MKKLKGKQSASDFWMDDYIDMDVAKDDIMELSSYRRAVANFVRIVTGDNIPVRYSSGHDSYTDGEQITISASTKLSERDSMVGLALHEGSHVKLTDFKFLKTVFGSTWNAFWKDNSWFVDNGLSDRARRMSESGVWDNYELYHNFKDVHNYVEDRRIDNFVMTSAPGYRPYYQALYDRYFNTPIVTKGLNSGDFREEDWNSYMFRLINITNPSSDLTALRGLQQIWDRLDLANISRIKDTSDSLLLAFEILEIIHDCLLESNPVPEPKDTDTNTEPNSNSQSSAPGNTGSGNENEENETNENEDSNEDSNEEFDEGQDTDDGENDEAEESGLTNHDHPSLSQAERQRLQKAIQAQKALQAGVSKKKRLSKSSANMVNAMDESETSVENVNFNGYNHKVIVVRKFTSSMATHVPCAMWYHPKYASDQQRIAVEDGIRMGVVLGKKLKVRAEERSLKFNRLHSGKIDKRMIAHAGYGIESIFQKIESFSYRPGVIHLSIDNSGSMSGRKFLNSLTTAAAIAKACSMIENMECVISFRSTGALGSGQERPMVVVAYDSRTQSISQLRVLLPLMTACGTTPEGLCFEAIMRDILISAKGKDAYFVNFSDGAPFYSERGAGYGVHYAGKDAYNHTRKQVNKMLENDIKVISYFIGNGACENEAFRIMYGQDAQFIDVTSINSVAKTMNNKFLEV